MVVLCQDGARGVIESAFSALDEVYVLKHGSKQAVKLNTNQISFLGEWSDAVEIINSVEVPPDVEAILGTEQLEQLQELAGQAPVHLEAMPQEGAHGAVAQLVIGPSTAKAVKAAVDTIVSHVDGLDYPEASYAKAAADGTAGALAVSAASSVDSCNLVAAGDQWMAPMPATQAAPLLYPPGSPPVMMVPVWPGSAGASLTWAQAGLPMADQSFLGSSASWTDPPQTVEVSVDAEPPPVQEIPLRLDQAEPTKQERPAPAAPPWRNKELPPPPEKKLAPEKLSERQTEVARTGTTVKRYRPSALAGKRRREVNVKQEVEEQDEEAGGLKAAKVVDEDSRSRQHGVAAAV
ncbi:unnamed protein product [Symbiodinium pilosum]|uniref:Uncharacterized protein n=1 Tax=Symbiodinium pilosum TaxID=2952 RepID=A0A812JPT1_SYMPI|nr:unnamed protein product [Symbiodinium pilosum]